MSAQPNEEFPKLDVRQVTPTTIPELSRLTGRSIESLLDAYEDAVKTGTSAWILMANALNPSWMQMEIAAAFAMGKCFYQQREAGDWVCVIHNQRSRFKSVDHSSRLPCMGIEP